MNRRDQVKNEIKQDIIDNLDEIVQRIYEIMDTESEAASTVESVSENIFLVVSDMKDAERERDELEKFLGKEDCPAPIEHDDGSVEVYTEINVRGICENISIANDIFRNDYRFVYKKGMKFEDMPESIKHLSEAYRLGNHFELKGDFRKSDNARKWLISVGLVGAIRMKGLSNKPYLLEKDIENISKKFIKNVENLAAILADAKYMSDPNDNGLALFDTDNSYSSKKIRFVKRKK